MRKIIKFSLANKSLIYHQLRLGSWVFMLVFGILAAMDHSFSVLAVSITFFLLLQFAAVVVDALEYEDD